MRLLMIIKYPPIEGGVSATNYWLARGLGEKGVRVTVVTNALCVEDVYRIPLNLSEPAVQQEWQPENVEVISIQEKAPSHIPYSQAFVSRLVGLALKEMGEHRFDAAFAHYLEPYGTSALLLKKLTGIPYVVRHAGSDIYRLLTHPEMRYSLSRVLSEADRVLFSKRLQHLAPNFGIKKKNIANIQRSLHPTFSPEGPLFDFAQWNISVPEHVPVLLYLGKTGELKGLLESVDALANVPLDFRFIMVTQGALYPELLERIAERGMQEKIFVRRFIPPWEVPKLLRSAHALLHLEHNFPIPIHSPTQPFEAIACGTPLVLSAEMYAKMQQTYPDPESFTIIEDPSNSALLERGLTEIIANAEKKKMQARSIKLVGVTPWDEYLDSHIKMFEQIT